MPTIDEKLALLRSQRAVLDGQIEVLEEVRRSEGRKQSGNGSYAGLSASAAIRAYLTAHGASAKGAMIDELERQIASSSENPRRSLMQAVYAMQRKGQLTKGKKIALK